jgi:hypothetical protein
MKSSVKNTVTQVLLYYLAYCLFLTELEGMSPEQWEVTDEILDQNKKRIVRQRTISSFSSLKNWDSPSSPTNSKLLEKVQPRRDAHHARSSVMPRHSSLRQRTLHNIAESDDVFSDENLTVTCMITVIVLLIWGS